MKRRRILSLALAVTLCLGLLPMTALAAGDFTIENGVLTKYDGPGGDVVIPDGVTEIGDRAFGGCLSLTSVTMPDSVTSIGDCAFLSCEKLTSVTIPDSVTTIGEGAFARCEDLTSVTIPAGVTIISKTAFSSCHSLTSVTIPESVTTIGYAAFRHCSRLTSVVIPDSVAEICDYAFDVCDSLADVHYGGSEEQWKEVKIGDKENGNAPLKNATIHFNSNVAAPTAYQSTQTVNVDGKSVEFQCYALKNEAGNMTNYIKLRDLAMLLNGTAAQFQVGWDGSVTITTKTAYTPNGTEGNTPFSGNRTYSETTSATKVNGQTADLAAFVLNDDNGGGYTYYQLRDLGKALGFNVGWSAEKGIYLETDKPYDPNN